MFKERLSICPQGERERDKVEIRPQILPLELIDCDICQVTNRFEKDRYRTNSLHCLHLSFPQGEGRLIRQKWVYSQWLCIDFRNASK